MLSCQLTRKETAISSSTTTTTNNNRDIVVNTLSSSSSGSTAFDLRLGQLRDYKRKHGDCLVPKRYTPNPTLGNWVNKQRQHYKRYREGKQSLLTRRRISLLEAEGFAWVGKKLKQQKPPTHHSKNKDDSCPSILSARERTWNERVDELKQYMQSTGIA